MAIMSKYSQTTAALHGVGDTKEAQRLMKVPICGKIFHLKG